jgi:hypothetical protein
MKAGDCFVFTFAQIDVYNQAGTTYTPVNTNFACSDTSQTLTCERKGPPANPDQNAGFNFRMTLTEDATQITAKLADFTTPFS